MLADRAGGEQPVALGDIWDFHVDLQHVLRIPVDQPYRLEQIDKAAAENIGGLFSATCRRAGSPPPGPQIPRDKQQADLEDQIRVIREAQDLTVVRSAAQVEGRGRQVLHAEGIYCVDGPGDLKFLDWLWEEGFRSLAPLYSADSALGGGCTGDPGRGLTLLGRELCSKAWDMGFLVDCAHANHKTKEDLAELALRKNKALHYTHGYIGAPFLARYAERGLPEETARKILDTRGLIGLSPHPGFLGNFEHYLEQIDLVAETAPRQVVLGSDFAGINNPGPDGECQFKECKGIWGVRDLAVHLARRRGNRFARDFCGGTLKAYLQKSLP
jgi:microsomal dipeptidase-like Zn-dependent dipeptidase